MADMGKTLRDPVIIRGRIETRKAWIMDLKARIAVYENEIEQLNKLVEGQ